MKTFNKFAYLFTSFLLACGLLALGMTLLPPTKNAQAALQEGPHPLEISSPASSIAADSTGLNTDPGWLSQNSAAANALAWGDIDGDGDLDLAVAGFLGAKVYLNVAGTLQDEVFWQSQDPDLDSFAVAWGDFDNDGDLDLAVGGGNTARASETSPWINYPRPITVYENVLGELQFDPAHQIGWRSSELESEWQFATSLAWGDFDGDGDLDLAAGLGRYREYFHQYEANRIYENLGDGDLQFDPGSGVGWQSSDARRTHAVAWGDFDRDGDLDLAAGNYGDKDVIYQNDGEGAFQIGWQSSAADLTASLIWGDLDGDGDLDLAAGIGNSGRNKIYQNHQGAVETTASWLSSDSSSTTSLAWGDFDGDGDLDLAAGNTASQMDAVYLNIGSTLEITPTWQSNVADNTASLAWADVDRDGDLDLLTGSSPAKLYFNTSFTLHPTGTLISSDPANALAWADYDNDGDLDLALAYIDQNDKIYENIAGGLQFDPANGVGWQSSVSQTTSLAWGDVDGDGDLDLAAGRDGAPNLVYENLGDGSFVIGWQAADFAADRTRDIAWGDVDGDGDLDLAVANGDPNDAAVNQNKIYENIAGQLETTAGWHSSELDESWVVRWGDVDGDGDLDLAVGNQGLNKLYLNLDGHLETTASWQEDNGRGTRDLAWGDVDGDGDLDLAAANGPWYMGQTNPVYENINGTLVGSAAWQSVDSQKTAELAWGDVDGDGDLDLAVANDNGPAIYLNENGSLQNKIGWQGPATDLNCLAWGDYDGDGDLDLVTGQDSGGIYLYENKNPAGKPSVALSVEGAPAATFNGGLATALAPADGYALSWVRQGPLIPITYTASNPARGTLTLRGYYSVDGGGKWLPAVPSNTQTTQIVPFGGPYDDLMAHWKFDEGTGAQALNAVTTLITGTLTNSPVYTTSIPSHIQSDDVFALSFDGTDDYVAIPDHPSLNFTSTLKFSLSAWVHSNLSVPQENGAAIIAKGFGHSEQYALVVADGRLRFFVRNAAGTDVTSIQSGNSFTSADGWVHVAAIFDASQNLMKLYLNGEEAASGAPPASLFDTDHLVSIGSRQSGSGAYDLNFSGEIDDVRIYQRALSDDEVYSLSHPQVFYWDLYASRFFGQSDQIVFRLEALPELWPQPNRAVGPYQFAYGASATLPFRVRGTQIRVYSETVQTGREALGAIVYRLEDAAPAGGYLLADGTGSPYRVDGRGYLGGRGEIETGDQLFALLPVTSTENYALYHTNLQPTLTGADGYTVQAGGVQTITVSAAHPLILFNLNISLEWDARNDPIYLAQLAYDLQRTAEVLFDWTDGQAALGEINIYQNREHWDDADIHIYASNRYRPNANQGGIVSDVFTETVQLDTPRVLTYAPGVVRMAATWNRYGDSSGELGEDWPRTLAHELGHYLFFLDDNYLGFTSEGNLIPIDDCAGVMSDPYSSDDDFGYDEFHPAAGWSPSCDQTLSNFATGRSDWETISHFYPISHTSNTGPNSLPLMVTQIRFPTPSAANDTLAAPILNLRKTEGGYYSASKRARAILFQADRLIDLGRPTLDQVNARGARSGDEVCVYDLEAYRLGCTTMSNTTSYLSMEIFSDWQPEVQVTPVTSRTVQLTVKAPSLLNDETVYARIYLRDAAAPAEQRLNWIKTGLYTGTFQLDEPAVSAYVRVWVDEPEPRRETLVDYALGGNPVPGRGTGEQVPGRGTGEQAPVVSGDGQVLLYAPEVNFPAGEFYSLQATTILPETPAWASPIGQGYHLLASAGAPDFAANQVSINISYLGSEVPAGEELWLKIFYWDADEEDWFILPTELDTNYNTASAPAEGAGLYALMSSLSVPIYQSGWNLFSYPIQTSRPITEALAAIDGYYQLVYHYAANRNPGVWQIYGVGAPGWVNDLITLEFNQTYWISVTQAITLYLQGAGTQINLASDSQLQAVDGLPFPPTVYYGRALANEHFTPTAGMDVSAWVDGQLCGQAQTQEVAGEIVYVVKVLAETQSPGCGSNGDQVSLGLDGQPVGPIPTWDNTQLHLLDLSPLSYQCFIPLVVATPLLAPDTR